MSQALRVDTSRGGSDVHLIYIKKPPPQTGVFPTHMPFGYLRFERLSKSVPLAGLDKSERVKKKSRGTKTKKILGEFGIGGLVFLASWAAGEIPRDYWGYHLLVTRKLYSS